MAVFLQGNTLKFSKITHRIFQPEIGFEYVNYIDKNTLSLLILLFANLAISQDQQFSYLIILKMGPN